MALSCLVSKIFNIEKYRDLEIKVKDQSRSLKVIPFLLVFYTNFVPKTHLFEIFGL